MFFGCYCFEVLFKGFRCIIEFKENFNVCFVGYVYNEFDWVFFEGVNDVVSIDFFGEFFFEFIWFVNDDWISFVCFGNCYVEKIEWFSIGYEGVFF